jgi:hypothetical protein
MKYLALACALLLGSCAGRKPAPPAQKSEPIGAAAPATDKEFVRINSGNPAENGPSRPGVVVQPSRTILDKLMGRTPKPQYYPAGTPVTTGKKATVTIYNAPATVTTTTVGKKATAATGEGATATAIDKAKGPTAIGDSATATDNTKAGQRGGGAAIGAGSTATATTVKPPKPWLKYALWASGLGFTAWVVFGGGGALLLALWRKNKPTDTTA